MIPKKFINNDFLAPKSNLDFGIYDVTKDKIIGYIAYDDGQKDTIEWDRSSLSACRGFDDLKLNMPAIKDYIVNSDDCKSSKLELFDFIVGYYESQLEDCY